MPINIGYIEATCNNSDVVVRVYYNANATPVGPTQPLVNGPRGFCLDVTNVSGRNTRVSLSSDAGNPVTFNVTQGNPVTTGQARSRTAAQMATLGFATRGDVSSLQIDC
jgi:hypothetical protein